MLLSSDKFVAYTHVVRIRIRANNLNRRRVRVLAEYQNAPAVLLQCEEARVDKLRPDFRQSHC